MLFDEDSFFRRHKIITVLLVLVLAVVAFFGYRMIGPYRYYKVDFVNVGEGQQSGVLEVGVAKADITPDLEQYDTYNDVDNDNKYNPVKEQQTFLARFILKPGQDTYNDRNNNGKFDPVWIAGFGSNRPAKGVHDPQWARAIAVRNNGVTTVMVTLDTIGVFHEKFIAIRKSLDPSLKIDHVMFSNLHIHEVADTMGNWSGPIPTPGAFDHKYMEFLKRSCKKAIEDAVKNLQPADMICAQVDLNPEGFVDDSRKPIVIDKKLCCARFVKHGTDPAVAENTIGTLVSWGNHPETLGGSNPLLTSDFCHYWREGVENGVPEPNGVEGLGGMCLYFQGMIGGLMTQLHTTVPHRNGIDKFSDDTFEKAQALGENLAIVTCKALQGPTAWKNENARVGVAAKTFYAPMAGLFKVAITLGLLHPGVYWGFKARSEVNVIRIGDVEILTAPGELYPEIADGGVEALPGRDFPIEPQEVPALRRDVMKGKMNLVVGLANDEIGYMIPKSQWDAKPPFVYNNKDQYGEENSGGPEVGVTYHHEAVALLTRMHDAWDKVAPAK